MNRLNKKKIVAVLMLCTTLFLYNCTRHDQTLNVAPASSTILTSVKTTTPPTFSTGGASWGGPEASLWNAAPKLTVTATVPDVTGSGVSFAGYIGNSAKVTMQSLYDANNIYFLIQWDQAQPNLESSPWYFNPTTKRWTAGGAAVTYDVNGGVIMRSLVSDQFDVIFNINNSCADFKTNSCFGACHQGITTMVVDTLTGNVNTQTTNVMHTNGPSEKLDCWRARMYQVVGASQAIDYYIDWNGGSQTANAVHTDQTVPNNASASSYSSNVSTNGTGGISNKQSKKITGTNTTVSVPLWVKSSGSHYTNCALVPSDTTGAALKVVAVDSNGVLTLSDASTLDPNSGTTYQQVGDGIGNNDQTLWIPGKIVAPYTGGVGDVAANAVWTGSGWQLMLKRALKTADVLEQDVDFSPLADQQFGIGVMFQPSGSVNAADNQHAIVPGLTLKFKK